MQCNIGIYKNQYVKIQLRNSYPVKEIYVSLFQRALYKVGELWEHNKISVAAEHMATSITEGLMNRIYPDIASQKRVGKKVIVSAVENEQHQVTAKADRRNSGT